MTYRIVLATIIGLATTVTVATDAATLRGPAAVIDADTLRLGDQVIRLLDVDAFELAQRCEGPQTMRACGAVAADALREKVAGAEVRCDGSATDDYDRLLARCTVSDEDLSTWLVAEGHGLAFRRYSERLVGTFSPSRRQIRSTRLRLTCQPARRSSAAIRRYP